MRRRRNPAVSPKLILAALAGVVAVVFLTRRGSGTSAAGQLGGGGSPTPASGPAGSPQRTFALRNFTPIRGGDPAFAVPIGTSSAMLNKVGCLIGSVTMGVNYLLGKNLTPLDANEVGKRTPGAFTGANTNPTVLGAAMGIDVPYKHQLRKNGGTATTQDMKRRIDDTLRKGGVVILHVDYDSEQPGGDPNGDHFIILLDQQGVDPKTRESMQASVAALTDAAAKAGPDAKAGLQAEIDRLKAALAIPGGDYICADPAGGKFRAMNPNTLMGPGVGRQPYSVVAVFPTFRSGEAPATLA